MNETGDSSVHVQGHAHASVVAGHHNLVIDARNGSVTLGPARERPRPVRREVVSVLPRPSRAPVGRGADTAALASSIAGGGLVQLCGPAGIGKSTLLRHLARTVPSGPDGTVFVSRAHHQAGDLAQEVFEACHETWGYAPSAADLRRLMTGVRVTVYVDDADLGADHLRRLTDLVPDATFVLASREASLLGDGVVHDLRGIDRDAAAELLASALGRPMREADRAPVAALWQAARGNPLLLVRAAGLARSVAPGPGGAEVPRPGAVPHLIPSLLARLDGPATSVLSLLATLGDAELAPDHIGALTGEPDPESVCARLADLGLVVRGEDGHHCAPGVVAARQGASPGFHLDRLCSYFTAWASDAATDPARVARHSRVFERVADLATATGRPDLAVALGRAASPALARSLRLESWGRVLARGWAGARRGGDRQAQAHFAREEATRCRVIGRHVVAAAIAALLLGRPEAGHGDPAGQPDLPGAPPDSLPGAVSEPAGDPTLVEEHMAELGRDTADGVSPDSPDFSDFPDFADFADFPDLVTGAGPTGQEAVPAVGAPDPSAATPAAFPTASPAPAVPAAWQAAGAPSAAGAAGAVSTAAAATGTLSLFFVIVVAVVAAVLVTRQEDSTPPRASGVVGDWQTSQGERATVRAAGPGSYTMPDGCGSVVRLTGTDTRVSGIGSLREEGQTCGPVIGRVSISISTSASGSIATVVVTLVPGQDDVYCSTCDTFIMTRVRPR